jgi:hypothetical protein
VNATKDQIIDVLGTANTLSFPLPSVPLLGSLKAGALATAAVNNPLGRAVLQAGMKLAAAGGSLQKGILAWESPADVTVDNAVAENRDDAGRLLSLSFTKGTRRDVVQQKLLFQMNPEAISEQLSPDWAEIKAPGQNGPVYQFINGGAREVTFTLNFFYGFRDRSHIKQDLDRLKSLTQRPLLTRTQNETDKAALGKAPLVWFYFGKYIPGERFVVKNVKIEASKMFDPLTLLPMLATAELTLAYAPEVRDDLGRPNNVSLASGRGDIRRVLGNSF